MNKKLFFSICTIFLVGNLAVAQAPAHRCGTDEYIKAMADKDPQLKADIEAMLKNNKQIVVSPTGEADVLYTIPVVFHILHMYGDENIGDAQVYDVLDIMNKDFQKRNSDTNLVVAEFDEENIADCQIAFRLATKDPDGNCTNGIEHIFTPETFYGGGNSKLNQWPREKYLNVWVASALTERPGAAAYALFPAATVGQYFSQDGIMALNTYVGHVGTACDPGVFCDHTLTHETGHYLGLPHPWGNTNSVGEACGDDGISDTPETKGFDHCPLATYQTAAAVCNPPIIENFQNFMEYSYCDHMFTNGQKAVMQASLNSGVGYRNNLHTPANLAATGALLFEPPYNDANIGSICSPEADFQPNKIVLCPGSPLTFENHTWRAKATSYTWAFEGGDPASSTLAEPSVEFSSPGWHTVSLTATNANGSTIKTQKVYVSENWDNFSGGYNEDFETPTADWWIVENQGNNTGMWERKFDLGFSGTNCYKLNVYNTEIFGRQGGHIDALISPTYDLRYLENGSLNFRYASATRADFSTDITEKLEVYFSSNCGESWSKIATLDEGEINIGGNSTSEYSPASSSDWGSFSIPLTTVHKKSKARFKFQYTAGDYSNNLFIDDVNVTGSNVGTSEILTAPFSFNVYPNPVKHANSVRVSFLNFGSDMSVQVSDVLGHVLIVAKDHVTGARNLDLSTETLAPGVYFISVSDGERSQVRKVVIY